MAFLDFVCGTLRFSFQIFRILEDNDFSGYFVLKCRLAQYFVVSCILKVLDFFKSYYFITFLDFVCGTLRFSFQIFRILEDNNFSGYLVLKYRFKGRYYIDINGSKYFFTTYDGNGNVC